MKYQTCVANTVNIYIAGDISVAENTCRRYCDEQGFCVTVTPTNYIYKNGQETGMIVGLINYPRFPLSSEELFTHAHLIAELLLQAMGQDTCTIQDMTESIRLVRDEAWEDRK